MSNNVDIVWLLKEPCLSLSNGVTYSKSESEFYYTIFYAATSQQTPNSPWISHATWPHNRDGFRPPGSSSKSSLLILEDTASLSRRHREIALLLQTFNMPSSRVSGTADASSKIPFHDGPSQNANFRSAQGKLLMALAQGPGSSKTMQLASPRSLRKYTRSWPR